MSTEATESYGEPWEAGGTDTDHRRHFLFDAGGYFIAEFAHPSEQTYQHDIRRARRAAACVNLLAGVPDAALTVSPAVSMFLAYLRGDAASALVFADIVQEEHAEAVRASEAGERFVSRRVLADALKSLIGELEATGDGRASATVHQDKINAAWMAAHGLDTPSVPFGDFAQTLPVRARKALSRNRIECWSAFFAADHPLDWKHFGMTSMTALLDMMKAHGIPIPERWTR